MLIVLPIRSATATATAAGRSVRLSVLLTSVGPLLRQSKPTPPAQIVRLHFGHELLLEDGEPGDPLLLPGGLRLVVQIPGTIGRLAVSCLR